MTVTATEAAQAIKYLHAAGAMNAVDDQEIVWADYINDKTVGVPEVVSDDLLPAARDCLKTWAAQSRAWKVDLPRYVESIKRIRNTRWTEYKQRHGEPYPDDHAVTGDGAMFIGWQRAAKSAVLAGVTDPDKVEQVAYAAIGREPEPKQITKTHHIDYNQIGQLK